MLDSTRLLEATDEAAPAAELLGAWLEETAAAALLVEIFGTADELAAGGTIDDEL